MGRASLLRAIALARACSMRLGGSLALPTYPKGYAFYTSQEGMSTGALAFKNLRKCWSDFPPQVKVKFQQFFEFCEWRTSCLFSDASYSCWGC
jgi:hypothetical protein